MKVRAEVSMGKVRKEVSQTLGDRVQAVWQKGLSKVLQSPVSSHPSGLCEVSALSRASSTGVHLGQSHRTPHAEGLCCRHRKRLVFHLWPRISEVWRDNGGGVRRGGPGNVHASRFLVNHLHFPSDSPKGHSPHSNQNLLWMQKEGSGVLQNANDQGALSLAKHTM